MAENQILMKESPTTVVALSPSEVTVVSLETALSIAMRAIEVFGSRDKAMRWLRSPIPVLGNQTPLAEIGFLGGVQRVENALLQVEHGVW
ncbi:MAG: MbcA/ParS/Xre antitoxin family protein [Acidobacteriota bacterium]